MLVVKVEVWPNGDAERAYPLGVMAVRNSGHVKDTKDLCQYEVEMQEKGVARRAHLTHWRRRGWLHLVRLALESVDGSG